jgi:D-beta-D-heptose 7-phosphate kinase/D-beta-D-heptose 1-phosphate adenosyltransferase
MIRVDREKKDIVNEGTIALLLDYIRKVITDVASCVISDYGKGVVSARLLEELIPLCKKHDVVTIVDPKIGNFGYYKGVSVITPNHYEAQDLTGIIIEDEESLRRCMSAIMNRLSCEAVVVTKGEEGMSVLEKGGALTHIPTIAKEVYDVTGAGDTVVAMLSLSLGAGIDIKESAHLANCAAGIVVQKVGTATVSREELEKAVKGL